MLIALKEAIADGHADGYVHPPLPVPGLPMLERALGYAYDAARVGFYWEPAGDEAIDDDDR